MLLAGPFPGAKGETVDVHHLDALLDAGIRSVFCLLDEDELNDIETGEHYVPYADQLEALAEARGAIAEIANHAIEDGSAPTDQEMEYILDAIDAEIDGRDSPTLIHCTNGHGRTGLVVGCYLARKGIAKGRDIIKKIQELRSAAPDLEEHKSPDNIVQERFVTRWKKDQ